MKLLVIDMHNRVKHGGISVILTALHEQYWILKGRQSILRKCVVCKKLEGVPHSSQHVPDLPACRVSENLPFAHTGLDFAGPLYFVQKPGVAVTAAKLTSVCSHVHLHVLFT